MFAEKSIHCLSGTATLQKKKSFQTLLSPQQSRCLSLLAVGKTAKQIAEQLQLSQRTVEHYLERVRKITNCRNAKELIAKYYQH